MLQIVDIIGKYQSCMDLILVILDIIGKYQSCMDLILVIPVFSTILR